MRKAPVSLVGVLLLSLALAACGGDGQEPAPTGQPTTATPQAGTVAIDLWHSETVANLETLERLVDRYNASQSEVKVRPIYQGNDEEMTAKLLVSLRGSDVPAIAYLAEVDAQKMIDSGAVTPIQDFIDREDYDLSDLDEKAVQYYVFQDKLWAMPFATAVPLVYWNKVMFRAVGLDPEKGPRDLEEVRQYSEKLLQRDGSGQLVRSGVAMETSRWYMDLTIAEHGDLFADNENGRKARATKVLFDGETGRWFFQWWHDMNDEGLAINVGRNITGAETFLAVAAGRAAMTFGSSAALRSVVDALDEGVEGVEIGVAPEPGVPGGTGFPGIYGRGLWVLNRRPQEEQEAAWKFIKWLMEPEQQAEWFAGSGYLPVSHASVDLPAAQDIVTRYPLFQVALDLYLDAPATPASLGALLGPFREIREFVAQAEESMLSGTADPIEALEEAATRSNQAIEEYNQRVKD